MKILFVLFIVSLIFPADVRPFEVKKAGRAVPASRLDEIQKSASKPESDQMAKLQEQILKRMYEKKLAQEQEGSSELSQDDIVADVIAETESPTPVPSEELLNDAQGSSALHDEGQGGSSELLDMAVRKNTQIEAHFNIKTRRGTLLDRIKKTFRVDDQDELVKKLIAQEKEHPDCYAFYHSCETRFRLIQDLYKIFYEFFTLKAKYQNFVFFRWTDPLFNTYDSADSFLKETIKERGLIDDNLTEIKTFIMSVNLSPFGGIGIKGETTWHYFLSGTSHFNPLIEWVLPKFFEIIGLDFDKFISDLTSLHGIIATEEGTLYQIFIPKEIVDKVAYLSWRHGIPNDPDDPGFIIDMFGSMYGPRMAEIRAILAKIEESHRQGTDVFRKQIDHIFDAVNKGRFKISTFLDRFKELPSQFKEPNMVQGRLLFTNDMLLNPNSGIKVYRYTTASEEKLKEYEKGLVDISDRMKIDWLEKNSNPETTSFSGEELDRVKNLLAQMKVGREFEGQVKAPVGKDILSKVRVLQELKEKQSEIAASSEKQSDAVTSLEQRLEQERQKRMKDMVTLHDEEKKDSEKSKQLSPFEALERQRQIREEKIRKGESLNLEEGPKIEPGKISQKRLDDLVDTLEYKKEPLPIPGKLKGEQADVKNQLEKIFGKKSDATPDVPDEVKPLPSVGKVNPAIQKELEKFFASQKKEPKKIPAASPAA